MEIFVWSGWLFLPEIPSCPSFMMKVALFTQAPSDLFNIYSPEK